MRPLRNIEDEGVRVLSSKTKKWIPATLGWHRSGTRFWGKSCIRKIFCRRNNRKFTRKYANY